MSRKRTLMPEFYKKKKLCTESRMKVAITDEEKEEVSRVPTDTEMYLIYFKNLFPLDKFEHRLPPMVLKHQLYSLNKNRTVVDKELNDLKNRSIIKMFKIGSEFDEYAIVFTEDYRCHVTRVMAEVAVPKIVADRFVNTVVTRCNDVYVNQDTLIKEYNFKDEDITQLLKASVLTVKAVGSWWLAVPNTGMFMKSLLRGRKAILTMIKKSKYKEILKNDLEQRKLPKMCRLGLTYHLQDIIGADLIQSIQTTSGHLLRLKD